MGRQHVVHNLSQIHWTAVVKIAKYLYSTQSLGMPSVIGSGSKFAAELTGLADSDYARSKGHRQSVSGGVVMYSGEVVPWFSHMQRCIPLSSTKTEHVAMVKGVKEVLFLRQVALEIVRPESSSKPIVVYEDNKGAVQLTNNSLASASSKHIDV